MKAIKQIKKVYLVFDSFWLSYVIEFDGDYGFRKDGEDHDNALANFKTKQGCINNFKKFASINGIEGYEIIGG